ncbi:MAG: cyclic nucleotide-binding domain-containing protein [bacterium]|nr:cyclic nucleotide-binding domain-containing protein [bacterium]
MVMQIVAGIASVFVLCSFFMKTMIPLRIIAIVSNLTFITYSLLGIQYGIFDKVYPILILHSLLLPLNIVRLYQITTLIRRVNEAKYHDTIDYLIPFMKEEKFKAGHVLFRKGDEADRMFFIQDGSVRFPEVGRILEKGRIFGEVGLFAGDNTRVASAVCVTDSDIYYITRNRVQELYFQNPRFGYFVVRIIADYVLDGQKRNSSQAMTDEELKSLRKIVLFGS